VTAKGESATAKGESATAKGDPVTAKGEPVTSFKVPLDSVAHTRTWMAWPDSVAIWGADLLPGVQSDIALTARTIARYEPVIMCANAASVSRARALCGSAVTVIGAIPVDDCWMRDSGPIFRIDGARGLDVIGLNFNGWGGKQQHAADALVAERVAAYVGARFTRAGLVSEGGAIETDGDGTVMATESSIINANRNPGMSRAQIEAAMCGAYGASKVIWFIGIAGNDITDDHVDATSRFVAAGRALVQAPAPGVNDEQAHDRRYQRRTLSSSTDARGNPIRVSRIQGPDLSKTRSRGDAFVGSYANYYVCNGAVMAQDTGDTAGDAAARATLAAAFPGRVVELLNIDHLANGGGGIHCVTQPQPAV
jgi:agmatine deiminase